MDRVDWGGGGGLLETPTLLSSEHNYSSTNFFLVSDQWHSSNQHATCHDNNFSIFHVSSEIPTVDGESYDHSSSINTSS